MSLLNLEDLLDKEPDKEPNKCIIRVQTSCYFNERGIHQKKSLYFLKKKSTGYGTCLISEYAEQCGADELFNAINNLNVCKDGIYEVVIDKGSIDSDTGMLDDYDFKLIEYEELKS